MSPGHFRFRRGVLSESRFNSRRGGTTPAVPPGRRVTYLRAAPSRPEDARQACREAPTVIGQVASGLTDESLPRTFLESDVQGIGAMAQSPASVRHSTGFFARTEVLVQMTGRDCTAWARRTKETVSASILRTPRPSDRTGSW